MRSKAPEKDLRRRGSGPRGSVKSNGILPLLFVWSDRILTTSWSRNKRAEEEEVLIAPSQQVVHGNLEVVGKVFENFHCGKITFLFPTTEVLTGKVGVFS